MNSNEPAKKYSKTKYIPNTKQSLPQPSDFRKKNSIIASAIENKPTTKKTDSLKVKPTGPSQSDTSKKSKNINLGL